MTPPQTGSRTCAQCGAVNDGTSSRCTRCGEPLAAAADRSAGPRPNSFCGECGAPLEPGIRFCGECGSAVDSTAAPAPPEPHQAIPEASRTADPTSAISPPGPSTTAPAGPRPAAPPVNRFCPACGATTKPGQAFCRICGIGLQGDEPDRSPTPPARRAAPTAGSQPARSTAAVPAPPKARSRVLQAILGVVVPVVSLVLTYYLTNQALGTILAQQFGDLARQVVPLVISLVVGGIARQIMTGR